MYDTNEGDYDLETFEEGYREMKYQSRGRDFILRVSDPYGLWTIHNSKGGVPAKQLEGSFTSAELAKIEVDRYMGGIELPNPELPNVEKPIKRVLKPKG